MSFLGCPLMGHFGIATRHTFGACVFCSILCFDASNYTHHLRLFIALQLIFFEYIGTGPIQRFSHLVMSLVPVYDGHSRKNPARFEQKGVTKFLVIKESEFF